MGGGAAFDAGGGQGRGGGAGRVIDGAAGADAEEDVVPFSLTMFRQETSFNSKAPTLRRRSPTMLRAEILAEGAKGCPAAPPRALLDGEDLEDEGGVSGSELPPARSDLVSQSEASLLESALLTLLLASTTVAAGPTEPARPEEEAIDSDRSKPPLILLLLLSLSGMSRDTESSELRLGCLGASIRSSALRSLVSSFMRWTEALRLSFSSSSDSRKALRSMAAFKRPSKSSTEANVLLKILLNCKIMHRTRV